MNETEIADSVILTEPVDFRLSIATKNRLTGDISWDVYMNVWGKNRKATRLITNLMESLIIQRLHGNA